jgi:hypothetical protein
MNNAIPILPGDVVSIVDVSSDNSVHVTEERFSDHKGFVAWLDAGKKIVGVDQIFDFLLSLPGVTAHFFPVRDFFHIFTGYRIALDCGCPGDGAVHDVRLNL